ncbi:MAG: KpsF/GutQ family sugar-phosphate isomerase [Planctomycetes bacterium]|nr:KpsF/GutQ family sugar-phosphate isomerase [Planctomycetota bacterium]
MTERETQDDIEYGRNVLEAEARAVRDLVPLVDAAFPAAVALLLGCGGRVVVTGVGKSGIIGQKISATLSSTGTPSLFLHSGEAVHGDLGRVLAADVVLALSYSGGTEEVLRLVPVLRKIGARLIAITSTRDSQLGHLADVTLCVGRVEEACPIGLAPTSSTTAMLALGDALAMTVAHRKHFDRASFALFHPGGALGRSLVTVGEVMRPRAEIPTVGANTTVADAIRAMRLPGRARTHSAVVVVDAEGALLGIFTQGDFTRRVVEDRSVLDGPVSAAMTRNPRVVRTTDLLADAHRLFEKQRFNVLPVLDATDRVAGVLEVQDVLEFGVAL